MIASDTQILPLFSHCLYVSGGERYTVTENEDKFIKKSPYTKNIDNIISCSYDVLEDESMSSIKEYILKHIEIYTKDVLRISKNTEFKIVSSWINLTTKGGRHHPHVHSNSVISGVFNLTPNNELVFGDLGGKPFSMWAMDLDDQNIFNSDCWTVSSKDPGNVILFPSTLMHQVYPYSSDNVRESISFNVMPVGCLTPRSTTQLKISV